MFECDQHQSAPEFASDLPEAIWCAGQELSDLNHGLGGGAWRLGSPGGAIVPDGKQAFATFGERANADSRATLSESQHANFNALLPRGYTGCVFLTKPVTNSCTNRSEGYLRFRLG